jgi:uncharacterized protein (DUF1697 family)
MRYVAFLRGINVSGQKLIKMEALRQHFEMPGIKNVVTYIQSGNVLFDSNETDEQKLRNKIEKQLNKQLGYDVPTIVRSITDIQRVIKSNPFKDSMDEAGKKLYVHFLSEEPESHLHALLDAYKSKDEEIRILKREAYLLTAGYGTTRLNNSLMEKKLGVTSTARNWATVNKITQL